MKSTIKTFVYNKVTKDGKVETSTRKVFVMQDDGTTYLRGYDLSKFDEATGKRLMEKFADHEIETTVSMPTGRRKNTEKRQPSEFDAGMRLFRYDRMGK